ncbi:glycosyltransferase family 4 protein [Variovorax sp. OV329]|uniref:glycosyltransferase family 4 protein n=1 Tax=Variovorax sp. OV329 TaxID=1882825 RepID=UPI0008E7428A|nr:glycosyltransferase family 4 protein [Variovorax sp. OV329]SFM07725.1 Glycosyltransferase involved in cell wall bisynthesis [Variovorax sp. OV329]
MKVLLYSHVFHPSTGGVETVSRTLAEGFAQRGIDFKLLTSTPADKDRSAFPFEVIRTPDAARVRELLGWADVVLFNGASLALQPALIFSRKPFIWVHVGYQVSCIDGLGWVDGVAAPMTPWASLGFHLKRSGPAKAMAGGLKLLLRRIVAKRFVARHVAITRWMDEAQPLPRQVQIYNPFPIDRFRGAAPVSEAPYDFVYLGRMVSEKGVDTLVEAFARVVGQAHVKPRLLLIGDGDRLAAMQQLARTLGVEEQVHFAGRQSGQALVDWVGQGALGIVPSAWQEPMGGVAIELMAAGRGLIVSEHGGLAECAGDAGLRFPNGNAQALAERMLQVLAEPHLRHTLGQRALQRSALFTPDRFVDQYIELLREASRKR